ncbi:MAG: thioredoxin [Candidatus Nanopelagicales bacterium]
MATIELTEKNFEEKAIGAGIAVVDFWAEWCGPCRNFAPVFEAASNTHTDITFGKVDTEAERELASNAQITSIPTLMVFRDGILIYREVGALPAPALEDLISAVRALDMDEVREQVANQAEGGGVELLAVSTFVERVMQTGAVVLDVRTPSEFAAGHAAGAILLDVQDPAFGINAASLDPSATYAIYCKAGRRAQVAAEQMELAGFPRLIVLAEGGFDDLVRIGVPTE